MQALVYRAFGEHPSIENVQTPTPTDDGVVIAVGATGVCRSDWHGWMGHDDDITLPHVPGHEFAGTIIEVGSSVTKWKIGDRVTVPFVCGCGACPECDAGDQQVCRNQFQPGFTHWGSFAEQVSIAHADTNLVRLPDDMDFVTAASLGCRFATAYRAVIEQGRLAPDQWLAIHGCGGVGLSAVMIAKAAGANVIAVDIESQALDLARSFGADITINPKESDVRKTITDVIGGAHVSIDALGSPETCTDSIHSLRRRGKHVQVGLMPGEFASTAVPLDRIIGWELEILGSHGMAAHQYPAMLKMISDGLVDPRGLVTNVIALAAAARALVSRPPGVTVVDMTLS